MCVYVCVCAHIWCITIKLFFISCVNYPNVRRAEEMGAHGDRVHIYASTHVCHAYRVLELSDNKLTSVPEGVFNNLTSLG